MVGGAGAGECEEHGGQGREYWCTEDRQLVCCDCLILGSHRGHRALPAHQAPQEGRDEWRVQGKEEREEKERTEDRWLQGPKNWRAEEESNVMPLEEKAISLEDDDDDESEDELVAMKDLQLASTAPAPSLPQPALWEVLLSLCEVRLLPAAAARALAVLAAPPEVPEERLAGLLTTRPGSLLSAARRRLTSHLASPGDQMEQQLLVATLGLVAACLAAPSAATSLAIFHVGRALSARCLDTGNSFMHDLTIVCASDEPAMASVAVRALARLASKASAPALVAASLPHLAPLLSSATPGVLLAAVTVVHEVAVTEEAAVLVTKAGLGVSLLLPALAALLAEQRRGALLPPRPMALVLGSVRALLAPLPPGSLPEPLLAELAAAVAWTEGEGSHERLVASVGAAPVLLPEYRHLQHFPTPDTRARLRILEQEFRHRCAAVGGAGTEMEGGQEELGVEVQEVVEGGIKRSVLDGRGKNLVDTKKDVVKSPGLPGWLGGEDESSDEEDFKNESRGDDYGEVKEVEALAGFEQGGKVGDARGRPREESDSGVSSDEAQPSPGAGGEVGGMEVVVKGELISVCQGRTVELWHMGSYRELLRSYAAMAAVICGFLNQREGGVLYVGVRRSREVVGLALGRKERDEVRQVVDRVVSQMLRPRLPTLLVAGRAVVEPDFVAVGRRDGETRPLHLARVRVAGWSAAVTFSVANVRGSGVQEGRYVRRGEGAACRSVMVPADMEG